MKVVRVDGKRNFFLSKSASDDRWRNAERLVAVAEGFLQGDVVTFSTAGIRNVVGETEKVDVAFTHLADPLRGFQSFVEVRARARAQGRPWIQELVGRKRSLQLESCLAVSTTGFTANAIKLACHEGIVLRTLSPLRSPEDIEWFTGNGIEVHARHIEPIRCTVECRSKNGHVQFFHEGPQLREYRFLRRRARDRMEGSTVARLFLNLLDSGELSADSTLCDDVEVNWPARELSYARTPFTRKLKHLSRYRGETLPVVSCQYEVVISEKQIACPFERAYVYSDSATGERLVEILEGIWTERGDEYCACFCAWDLVKDQWRSGAVTFPMGTGRFVGPGSLTIRVNRRGQ